MSVRKWLSAALVAVLGMALMTVSTTTAQAAAPAIWGSLSTFTASGGGAGGVADSVSCPVSGECTIVGTGSDNQPMYVTVSAGILGLPTSISGAGGGAGSLKSVSCVSGFDCVAVGSDDSGAPIYVVITSGAAGTAAAVTVSGGTGSLQGISCTSATDCVAVGYDSSGPIAVTMTSGVWGTPTQFTVTGGSGTFQSVSCTASGTCTAVGENGSGQPIVATMTSGTWGTAVEVGPVAQTGVLLSVSCTSATECTAVGWDINSSKSLVVTKTSGSWGNAVEVTPPGGGGLLNGVSCTAATDCVAVGSANDGEPFRITKTSSGWGSPVSMASPSGTAALYDVSCVTTTECLAVGKDSGFDEPMYATTSAPYTIVVYGDPESTRAPMTGAAPGEPLGVDPDGWMAGYTGLVAANGVTIEVEAVCPSPFTPSGHTEGVEGTPDGTYWAPPPACSEGSPTGYTVKVVVAGGSCLVTAGLAAGTWVVGSTAFDLGSPYGTTLPYASAPEAYQARIGDTAQTFNPSLVTTVGVYLPAARACAPVAPTSTATSTTSGSFAATSSLVVSNGGSQVLAVADSLGVNGYNRILAKPLEGLSSEVYGGYSSVYSRCGQTNVSATALTCLLSGVRVTTGGTGGRWDPGQCAGQEVKFRSRVVTQMGYGLWSDPGTITMAGPCT